MRDFVMPFEKNAVGTPNEINDYVHMRDRMEYVADLLAELQVIVAPAACQTLTGLLVLSEAEARRVAKG
jgi:hypothetical protein